MLVDGKLVPASGGRTYDNVNPATEQVIVSDSTSVNLFKLVMAALGACPGRRKIVTDELNFPSDLYILQGALRLAGPDYSLQVVHSTDGMTVGDGQLAEAIDRDTALVVLTHTAFKSGFVYDMPAVTGMAHRSGALMLWDLCHSVGAMPLALDAAEVDLAVGCTYKYLNGGPGSPAFLEASHPAHLRPFEGHHPRTTFQAAYRRESGPPSSKRAAFRSGSGRACQVPGRTTRHSSCLQTGVPADSVIRTRLH